MTPRTAKLFLRCNLVILAVMLAVASGPILGRESGARPAGQEDAALNDATRATAGGRHSPLYLLTYDHGGLILWGHDHLVEHLREAITWLERYPSFKIGLDNEAYTYDALSEQAPEVLAEIRSYLKHYPDRFGIGTCTYGQPLSVFINEESNVRQIEYALEADHRHLGCKPEVYLMSEHAMHSQMPQLLAGFGFEGAIMRTHYMMYGYNPTFDVPIGLWSGVDGSRIPAIPTYAGQGAEFGRTTKDNWILTRYPSEACLDSLEDFAKEFSRIAPLLATRADDAGLRREELVRRYEGRADYRWVLLEEIFPTFPKAEQELRTAPNDFRVRMPWGYCGNEIWNTCREAETAVLTAERLAALKYLAGGNHHEAALQRAWKSLLVAQHHDIQICGLLDDARRFLRASLAASEQVRQAALRFMADRMEGGTAGQVTVFNPLSWPREQWIEVRISPARGTAHGISVRNAAVAVPSAMLSADRHSDGSLREARIAFRASVPPLGVVSYSLEPDAEIRHEPDGRIEVNHEELRVRTPFLNVHLDPHGGIQSMDDSRNGTALLKAGMTTGLLAGRIDGRDCESEGIWAIEAGRNGAPWATAYQSGILGSIPYRLEMVFRADTSRIDCRVNFHFKGQQIGLLSDNKRDHTSGFLHEHKVRFKLFPAVSRDAHGVRDLPFVISETPDAYVNGIYWNAVTDGDNGLAYFNRGAMGSVREPDGGYSIPLAFAMYYIWGTRMLNGEFTYDFAVDPFQGDWGLADLHRRALEYNFPLVCLFTSSGNGELGNEFSPFEITSGSVVLSALYSKGASVYARLYEHRGKDGSLRFRYSQPLTKLVEVDLRGNEGQSLPTDMKLRPWQIRTFKIETSY